MQNFDDDDDDDIEENMVSIACDIWKRIRGLLGKK
jgi:hypothetical protein